MDEFIHDKEKGLEKFIHLKLSNLWIVYENEKVVAFFALSKDSIILNSEDRRILESKELNNAMSDNTDADFFWEKEKYPAVEIDYLAVCKEMREDSECHLGAYIVDTIAQRALLDEFSATMFLTVEALDTPQYSAVEFYRKCDFEYSDVAQNKYNYDSVFGNRPTTRRMYRLILPVD